MGKTARLNIRVTEEQHELLRRAAATSGQTISDYVLSHVLADAHDDLADQRLFLLDAPEWSEFVTRLDRPGVHRPELEKLLAATPPWEGEGEDGAAALSEIDSAQVEDELMRLRAALAELGAQASLADESDGAVRASSEGDSAQVEDELMRLRAALAELRAHIAPVRDTTSDSWRMVLGRDKPLNILVLPEVPGWSCSTSEVARDIAQRARSISDDWANFLIDPPPAWSHLDFEQVLLEAIKHVAMRSGFEVSDLGTEQHERARK